jgi:hypothetical protein
MHGAVKLDDVAAPGTLVEAIHVLSDDGDAGTGGALLKLGKRNVR